MVTMDQRLMVGSLPEQRVTRASHSNDVINVCVMDSGGQSAATRTDSGYTEESFAILTPLVTIATLRRGRTRIPRIWLDQRWLTGALRTASARRNQDPWMFPAGMRRLVRHYLLNGRTANMKVA